jgi:succinate dehydrogenase/fumarate reductase flavoprotein subunit
MNDETCDVLVIGSGAAGLTTAVTAQHYGCKVIIAEKSNRFGGSSALSGGWLWIPLNPSAVRDGMKDSVDEAVRYVKAETREHFNEELVRSYLAAGPCMIEFLEQNTSVRVQSDYTFADYHPPLPVGMRGGRSFVAEPFDGRELG